MNHTVIHIGAESRYFTLAEAQALLPVLRKISRESQRLLAPVQDDLSHAIPGSREHAVLQQEYARLVQAWKQKMERLGVETRSLWNVDLHTGDGCLCWRFPEHSILYWHAADEDCSNRRPLQQVIEEHDPDWVGI